MPAADRPELRPFGLGEREILELIAHGAPLARTLCAIVELVERQASGMACSILLYDQRSQVLSHGAAPSLPLDYVRAIDGSRAGPMAGSCGTAAHDRRRVIVADIAAHPAWRDYKQLALPHGLAACWSEPIQSPDGEVLGTFAMYYREARPPRADEIDWVEAAGALAAIAIVRDRAEVSLRAAERRAQDIARVHAVARSVSDTIVRVRDPRALYEAACTIAVEHGLVRLAWVGLYDDTRDRIHPVARSGEDRGYVDEIALTLKDRDRNRGPAARALLSGVPAVANDIAHDGDFFFRDAALSRGLAACAAFPLKVRDRTLGVLAMYGDRPGHFGPEEVRVLTALADNIAFAIESAVIESERRTLVDDLRERVKELTLLHEVAKLLHSQPLDNALFEKLAAALPTACRYPERCVARVAWGEVRAASPGWRSEARSLAARFEAHGEAGCVEVAYLPAPAEPAPEFVAEERALIDSVAALLATHIERHESARALRQSEERLRAVLESAPNVGVQWFDASARLLYANPASIAMFGWDKEAALGRTLDELGFPAADAALFADAIQEVAARGTPVGPREFRYTRADGSAGVLMSTVFRVPDAESQYLYVCTDVDLTEHRRMEERIRADERLRAAVFDAIDDGVFYVAVEAPDRYRLLSVNRAFLALSGMAENAVTGRLIGDIFPEPTRAMALSKLAESMATGRSVQWEQVDRATHGQRYCELTLTPTRDERGNTTHFVGTVRDITERKLAEQQRRKLEAELQQSERLQSLGTLAAGIAHDFNNILRAIAGNTELALDGALPSPATAEHLTEIRKAAQRGSELVREILAFGRQQEVRREEVHLRHLVEDVASLLRATAPPSIGVRTSYVGEIPAVSIDAPQIHRVLMNLGVNAIHAIGTNAGTVSMEVRHRCLDEPLPGVITGDCVSVRVIDDGCGMDAATLQRIFEPFFTTKPAGKGTGLGLSVAHGIVTSHGGTLLAESEPGTGTAFELILPSARSSRPPVPAAAPPAVAAPARRLAALPPAENKHVLYVDDDAALVFLATRLLKKLGYRVTAHTSPGRALADLRAQPDAFDAVLSDMSMGNMTGIEFARDVLGIRPDIPIVIASGYVRDGDVETARALGVRDLVLKPSTIDDFGAIVHRALGAPELVDS